jgi:hypothetical protein
MITLQSAEKVSLQLAEQIFLSINTKHSITEGIFAPLSRNPHRLSIIIRWLTISFPVCQRFFLGILSQLFGNASRTLTMSNPS